MSMSSREKLVNVNLLLNSKCIIKPKVEWHEGTFLPL